jgi:hypothetical protein
MMPVYVVYVSRNHYEPPLCLHVTWMDATHFSTRHVHEIRVKLRHSGFYMRIPGTNRSSHLVRVSEWD